MAQAAQTAPPQARRRNQRGLGGRLREEIITAASQMIGETGDDTALTLRGVARRVGIAAPSIYRHFTDVDELKRAMVQRSFAEFASARDAATGDGDDPARPPVGLLVFQTLASSIRRCQQAGLASAGDDPRLLAAQVWAAPHGLVLLRLNPPGFAWPGPLEQMADQAVARLIGLETRRTGTPPDRPPKGELPCIPSPCPVTARAPRRSQG